VAKAPQCSMRAFHVAAPRPLIRLPPAERYEWYGFCSGSVAFRRSVNGNEQRTACRFRPLYASIRASRRQAEGRGRPRHAVARPASPRSQQQPSREEKAAQRADGAQNRRGGSRSTRRSGGRGAGENAGQQKGAGRSARREKPTRERQVIEEPLASDQAVSEEASRAARSSDVACFVTPAAAERPTSPPLPPCSSPAARQQRQRRCYAQRWQVASGAKHGRPRAA
jgi:hypothetical protein